jgi:hypothetical protein
MPNRKPVASPSGGAYRRVLILALLAITGGCAVSFASNKWDEYFGPAEPRQRMEASDSEAGAIFLEQVQPILEQRCIVCHGCYDSPCQLNMIAAEGIDRGANKKLVYDAARLSAATPTRLLEDARTTAEWRQMGFYPVLNEREQSATANLEASVMHHMLQLKRDHPLPKAALLPDSVTLALDRKQQCPKPEEMDEFIEENPLWGMPYGMRNLPDSEFNTLEKWLENGSRMARPAKVDAATQAAVDRWETFLNGDGLKQQLVSRYLYEHWFLAHLYFDDMADEPGDGEFFRLVRSSTPPGEPIANLATRRPYDDPGTERFYYRLWRDHTVTLDKTHMPYALNTKRLEWLSGLFLEPDYTVTELPSYEPAVAANPFIAFSQMPVESRWEFLVTESKFTIMNFIKGPVCRGQVALSVVRDHFWIFFNEPKLLYAQDATAFLNTQEANLRIPVEAGSTAAPLRTWRKYSKYQDAYLKAKSDVLNKFSPDGKHVTLDLVWDGYGENPNAALTIFRHFDSASVVAGLVGPNPKTAWIIDYPILERIHYLLVAGYDVFGNMGHQLTTRLYMDFLRMEGEFNFLSLLPPETRVTEREKWYAGASKKQKSYIFGSRASFDQPTQINYKTDNPKQELFTMLRQRLAPVLDRSYDLGPATTPAGQLDSLQKLQSIVGLPVARLPELTYLAVKSGNTLNYYSVIHHRAHSNITSLFRESKNLLPEEDTLTVAANFVGSYPNAYWLVEEEDLLALVERVAALTDEASYRALMDRYGVRRTSKDFWQHSDKVMAAHYQADPIANALLDYNRLENR